MVSQKPKVSIDKMEKAKGVMGKFKCQGNQLCCYV
jgi:hypothetical protein